MHTSPRWFEDQFIKYIFDLLETNNMHPLFVGGCVRDFYKKLPPSRDIDMVVGCNIHIVCRLFDQYHIKYETIGIDYGTIGIYKTINGLATNYHIEITSLRLESNYDGRYPTKVNFDDVDIKQDAARRDFTINALYWHPKHGLYDFYHGLDDLQQGKLRFIGDAKARIDEDYLRILRYFRFLGRFSKYDNLKDTDTLLLLQDCADYLTKLKSERVGHEMIKIFALSHIGDILGLMAQYDILSPIGLEYSIDMQYALDYYQQMNIIDPYAILSIFLIDKPTIQQKKFCQKWSINYKKLMFFQPPYYEIINFARQYGDIHITRLVQNHHTDISHKILTFMTALGYINQQKTKYLAKHINTTKPMELPMSNKDIISYYGLKGIDIANILHAAKNYYLDNEGNINRQDLITYLDTYVNHIR